MDNRDIEKPKEKKSKKDYRNRTFKTEKSSKRYVDRQMESIEFFERKNSMREEE